MTDEPRDATATTDGEDAPTWLSRHTPEEWIRAALAEVSKAEQSFRSRDARAAVTACKRAAGMGLNAALIVRPNQSWGRKYIDHVVALSFDTDVPAAVRSAAEIVSTAQVPTSGLVLLRTPGNDHRLLEATRDVIAHAYAVLKKHEPPPT